MSNRPDFEPSPLTRVRRQPARACYERSLAHAVLDEALVASVGFVENGQPFVIPMTFGRLGDSLVLHAARSSRFQRALSAGGPLCVTVTLLDGLVLARSAMHHSLNYRSVVVFGSAREVTDDVEKRRALDCIVDHVLAGRSRECRAPNARELRATSVFAVPLEVVSIKRRVGGPSDDADDLSLPFWAGEVPLELRLLRGIPDPVHAPRGAEPEALAASPRR